MNVTTTQVLLMARTLSDRSSEACNVNADDNWKIYHQMFIDDVRAMLLAIGATVD
jgi:hypothetical protein